MTLKIAMNDKQTIRTSYNRYFGIEQNAIPNKKVNQLLTQHHKELWETLINMEGDDEIYNITYLYMTRKYTPQVDFVLQFRMAFYMLKKYGKVDDRCLKWLFVSDGEEILQWLTNEDDEDEETPITTNEKLEIIKIINDIKDANNHKVTKETKDNK